MVVAARVQCAPQPSVVSMSLGCYFTKMDARSALFVFVSTKYIKLSGARETTLWVSSAAIVVIVLWFGVTSVGSLNLCRGRVLSCPSSPIQYPVRTPAGAQGIRCVNCALGVLIQGGRRVGKGPSLDRIGGGREGGKRQKGSEAIRSSTTCMVCSYCRSAGF